MRQQEVVENKNLKNPSPGVKITGKTNVEYLPLKSIRMGSNSRLTVSDEEIAGLMQSIKEVGLLQPIGVVRVDGGYEVTYGNRRFLAISRLGLTRVQAVIHENESEAENSLMNLTENVQRRNISLAEIGRYIELLKESGMSNAEIGVRLGVSKPYVVNCFSAYRNVPSEFRESLDITSNKGTRNNPGKISMHNAQQIISASNSFGLSKVESKKLFQLAKSDERFDGNMVKRYAASVKAGSEDPISDHDESIFLGARFIMTTKNRDILLKKYVKNGRFKSLNDLFVSILTGKAKVKIQVVSKKAMNKG